MIRDNERREVARRLREHSGVRLFTGEDVERLIGIELSGFRPKDADNSYNRLADLIEPEPERTCHYIYDKEICAWRCSECGGLEPVCDHVRYCPDCGARIEDEVDG